MSDNKITCRHCGELIDRDSNFCPACGAINKRSFRTDPNRTYCVFCGSEIAKNEEFCPICGTPVREETMRVNPNPENEVQRPFEERMAEVENGLQGEVEKDIEDAREGMLRGDREAMGAFMAGAGAGLAAGSGSLHEPSGETKRMEGLEGVRDIESEPGVPSGVREVSSGKDGGYRRRSDSGRRRPGRKSEWEDEEEEDRGAQIRKWIVVALAAFVAISAIVLIVIPSLRRVDVKDALVTGSTASKVTATPTPTATPTATPTPVPTATPTPVPDPAPEEEIGG